MKHHSQTVVDALASYFRRHFFDELRSWKKLLRYFLAIWVVALAALVALVVYMEPYPFTSATLYSDATAEASIGESESYASFFRKNGLVMRTQEAEGVKDGLRALQADRRQQGAAYSLVGSMSEPDAKEVYSLGAVDIAPIWLFHRADIVLGTDLIASLRGRRVNVGSANSTSQLAYTTLFKGQSSATIVYDPDDVAIAKLAAGEIDAIFLVGSLGAPAVQRLLNDERMSLYSFDMADAYVRVFPSLQKVNIPAGALSLAKMLPRKEILLLAASVELVVNKTLHPAYQWAYLLAAKEFRSRTEGFFTPRDYFPRKSNSNVELSPIAKDYFEHGAPETFKYLSLWLAASLSQFWFYLIAAALVGYPALASVRALRGAHVQWFILSSFMALKRLEERIVLAETLAQLQACGSEMDALERRVMLGWFDSSTIKDYFDFRQSLSDVRQAYDSARERLLSACDARGA